MTAEPESTTASSSPATTRPLWRWILRALAPTLAYLGLVALSLAVPWDVLMFANLTVGALVGPPLTLFWLIRTADEFCRERGHPSREARVLFVLGFGLVSTLLWFGGCGSTLVVSFLPDGASKPSGRSPLEYRSPDLSSPRPTVPDAPPPPAPAPEPASP